MTYRIAVVGTGPRGLAVLERLAARLAARPAGHRPVEIHAVDDHRPGPGRIWRPDQSPLLLMNTPAGDVTLFSGPADGGPARPGAGPTLAEWWSAEEPGVGGPEAYAPRALYGRYLEFVLDAVRQALPAGVTLHTVRARVDRLRRAPGGGWTLHLADGGRIGADRVLLSTGHSRPRPDRTAREHSAFAAAHGLAYVPADSAADMALDGVPAGAPVGVIGLGMAFYDVMALLTEGRGGRFVPEGDGLRYRPSGAEPVLVAGSRSGVPMPARGVHQKRPDYVYRPRLFTFDRVTALRARGRIDFDRDLMPWLRAELGLVHHATALRARRGDAGRFTEAAVRAALAEPAAPDLAVAREAVRHGLADAAPVDLTAWARPFAGARFPGRDAYRRALAAHLEEDLRRSVRGNVDDPVKAAVELLRVVRGVLRAAVDGSGLTPRSHEKDFLGVFAPVCAQLSSGPPVFRLRQVLALLEAGILRVPGPGTRFGTDPDAGRFTAWSPQVDEAPLRLAGLIDARVPAPDVRRDASPLVRDLYAHGTLTSYANGTFDTGGVAVTAAPFHPLDTHGRPVTDLHVTGIPLEGPRWFTQVGSGRAGAEWSDFTRDADTVAASLAAAVATERAPAAA
ncbi:FAD/NAD(P)-binding protein [Streptomyces sp. NPDC001595]|uniref:FAD/NAD(P)-binding protein n=1 Tax=Streptomyces sp. NPDC001532 TaxID=3154520 RepID=UPI00332099D4